ncbi:hypothetical protein SAMN05428988_1236 [Chitinophaga sp. YR573]|uniref:hypothetical protein n=1 Tax=Chitinophaga sp. YR573 TaxID=1881040 RepID=UPI0008AD149E|nr:hypothetical protein [Chitinophaga sp. YR573]SEW01158.1 hypothetical protein SAMN05428988_1236 [Chitinophaga sp. YR573]
MSFFKKIFSKQVLEISNQPGGKTLARCIVEFQQDLNLIEWDSLKDVEYAMWFPSDEDATFTGSPVTEKWTQVYSITKDYWSYIAANLLDTLGVIEKGMFRTDLPEDLQAYAFVTKGGEQVILSISKEKGIRLHFAATTSLDSRLHILSKFILYCKAWKDMVGLTNEKPDEDPGFAGWWNLLKKTSEDVEKNEPLTGVGQIVK